VNEVHGIPINDKCNCSILLSNRDIIEIAFSKLLKTTASVIVTASLVNPDTFGKFEISNLFVIDEGMLRKFDNSPFYKSLLIQLQLALKEDIYTRQMGIPCNVLFKSICEMSRPVVNKSLLLHDKFTKGSIHQVLSETYGVYFSKNFSHDDDIVSTAPKMEKLDVGLTEKKKNICYLGDDTSGFSIQHDKHYSAIIGHRGQGITEKGITKTFHIKMEKTRNKEKNQLNYLYICK
jgi:hypothetical protein